MIKSDLKKLRGEIDKIDEKITKLISKRFKITRRIGIYKKNYNLSLKDSKREKEIFNKTAFLTEKLNINPSLIRNIFKLIIREVKKEHRKIKNS